jgi:flagellar biogenesis protein FliO
MRGWRRSTRAGLRRKPRWAVAIVLAAMVVAATVVVPAEVTAEQTSPESAQGTPIAGARARSAAVVEEGKPGAPPGLGFAQLALALTGVVTLILVLRWAAGRVVPGMAGAAGSRVLQVLARGAIGPRQQVVILRVGRRIIVAGSSGGQLSTLCEITDPDETSELIGQLESEKGESMTRAFASMFSREREKFDDVAPAPDGAGDQTVAEVREELGGLMEKVRLVSRQFRS